MAKFELVVSKVKEKELKKMSLKSSTFLMLACASGVSLLTSCANFSVESLKSKADGLLKNASVANAAHPQKVQVDAENELTAAQAEADKICASHIVFFDGVQSGKVEKMPVDDLGKELEKSTRRGFYSIEITRKINDNDWILTYAFSGNEAKYGTLVAARTNWHRMEISGLDLIEKFKKRDPNAEVKHFFDTGEVAMADQAKTVDMKLCGRDKDYCYEGKLRDLMGRKGGPRAYGLKELTLQVEPESKVVSRQIGFVLGGKDYQVIINESSTAIEVGAYATQCPVTGIDEAGIGRELLTGNVELVIEDTAQMAAYRGLYKEFVEKKKAENKAEWRAKQEKNLHF